MANSYVDDIIRQNRPVSLKIEQSRVLELVQSLGYTLVPCRQARGPVQISNAELVDGEVVSRWFLKDIEEADYVVYRLEDGKYIILGKSVEAPAGGVYVSIMEAWPILEAEGYRLFVAYETEDVFYPYPAKSAPEFHYGDGFSCFKGGNLAIWWSGSAEGRFITYEPYIPGGRTDWGTELPNDISQALFAEAGVATITVTIDPMVVEMPEPNWLTAGEYWIASEKLPLPEARQRAAAFVARLRDMGLVD